MQDNGTIKTKKLLDLEDPAIMVRLLSNCSYSFSSTMLDAGCFKGEVYQWWVGTGLLTLTRSRSISRCAMDPMTASYANGPLLMYLVHAESLMVHGPG